LKGDITVTIEGNKEILQEGECGIIDSGKAYYVERPKGTVGMAVTQNPEGNKFKQI